MKDRAKKSQKESGTGHEILSFGLHLSELFHGIVVEQYKMKRGEQVCIYMSETPGGLHNSCGFHLMSPHGNLISTIRQLCLHVHEYAQVLCVSTFQKKSVNILQLLKTDFFFFTAFLVFFWYFLQCLPSFI